MWESSLEPHLAAMFGLAGGIVLGLAARLGRFCALGAIEDVLYGGSNHRARMWILAIGVAVTFTFFFTGLGLVDLENAYYLRSNWNPVSHIVGGLIFGYGMALAGNCGYGAVARLGGGDLRAFVIVLVMGISAYVVMAGPLAPLRVFLFPPDLLTTKGSSGFAHLMASALGGSASTIGMIAGFAIIAATLASQSFRQEGNMLFWGVAVGGTIAITWAGMHWLSEYTFGEVSLQNHTFAEPLGEVILFAMTSSSTTATFAIGSVGGVWLGALIGSGLKGHFRWEACEDPRELRRQIFGAVMMGAGAILAIGCTVGEGLSAVSVLSFSAPLTILAIIAGASLGLRSLIVGFNPV